MTMDRRVGGARLLADCSVTLRVDGVARPARTLDLSVGGALVHEPYRAGRPLPLVCPVELSLAGRQPIRAVARTVRSRAGQHALRFVGLSEVDRLDIAEHLDRLYRRGARAA